MLRIRKQDQVVVIAGRDKGKHGEVMSVLPKGRYLVSGVHMVKKHTKPNPNMNIEGGIIEKEAPIQGSNIAIYNLSSSKADRVGFQFAEGDDGKKKKIRVYKSTQTPID